jgi:hypothetical protein
MMDMINNKGLGDYFTPDQLELTYQEMLNHAVTSPIVEVFIVLEKWCDYHVENL